jgi:hypothetical protein
MPKLSLGEIFSVSRQSLHIQIFLPFLVPTIFYILATSYLFQYLGEGLLSFQTGGEILTFVYKWSIFIILALLIYLLLMVFSFNLSSIVLRDFATVGKKNYANSIREAYSKILKVLFVNILAFIIVSTGILFYAIHPVLLLMGFFLAPFFSFVSHSIIIDNLSPFKALKNSMVLSLHYTGPSFVLFIFSFFLLVFIPASFSLVIYYFFSSDLLGKFIIYGIPIFELIFGTYVSILITVAYLNYRGV